MTKEVAVKTIKQVGGIAISFGVAVIVGNAVKFTTPATIGKLTKVCVGLGSFALGGLAADATVKYANQQIDEIADAVEINLDKTETEEPIEQTAEA